MIRVSSCKTEEIRNRRDNIRGLRPINRIRPASKKINLSPCGVCTPTEREAQVVRNDKQRTSSAWSARLPLRPLVVAMLVSAFVSFTMADASPVTAEDQTPVQTIERFSFTAGHTLPKSVPEAQTASARPTADTPAVAVGPANRVGAPAGDIVPRATASIPHSALAPAREKAPAACRGPVEPVVATPPAPAPTAVTPTRKAHVSRVSHQPRQLQRHRVRRHHESRTRRRAAPPSGSPKWFKEAWSPDN